MSRVWRHDVHDPWERREGEDPRPSLEGGSQHESDKEAERERAAVAVEAGAAVQGLQPADAATEEGGPEAAGGGRKCRRDKELCRSGGVPKR